MTGSARATPAAADWVRLAPVRHPGPLTKRPRRAVSHVVTEATVAPRPTAVVPATTTWQEFPTVWKELLDDVWACLRAGGIDRGCRNVMLYKDDRPRVEVGV